MKGLKPFKGLRTYIGIAVLALPGLLKHFFDIQVSEAEVQALLEQLTVLAGSLLAIYGRYDAKNG